MSLSLSSLLNPSNGTETSATPAQQESGLPNHQEPRSSASPTTTRPPHQHSHSPSTAREAAQALAALSTSPVPTPSQWHGSCLQDQNQVERRLSIERRPGSGYGDSMQLPPPPQGSNTRKMSSPTLEQYRVASRSPEQRRASLRSPTSSNIILPPIQAFATSQAEQTSRASHTLGNDLEPSVDEHTSKLHPDYAPSLPNPAVDGVPSAENPPQHTFATSHSHLKSEYDGGSSPAMIKQEKMPTPQPLSPVGARQPSDAEQQSSKTVASLKLEHGAHTHSPLRESSIPIPTTEVTQPERPAPTKKRPASAKTKKGTATTMKKAPPTKKRKLEPVRSATPLSQVSKANGKIASGKGTPTSSSPAPSARSYSADHDDEPADDDEDEEMEDDPDADVYCICRRPDNGTFMIGCDGTCDDWFHGKCVGIEERDKNLIDRYICPNCTKAEVGRTTWKRMCRRRGCRQPAKVSKSKGGAGRSKYCSDECGVLFFRDLVGRTRGREDAVKHRSSRRKGSSHHDDRSYADDDLGARGGVLAAGEVKALLISSRTAADFHRLGDGVLSPPATPDGSDPHAFTNAEQATLAHIHSQKEEARRRHTLLKDRMKFVTLVKQAATRTTAEKELKPKDYCGYDSRLEWGEEQFSHWRSTKYGRRVFELDTIAPEPSTNGTTAAPQPDAMDIDTDAAANNDNDDDDDDENDDDFEVCDRKKCARHLEWSKLVVDDLRFEMSDNGDRMRALDKEEKDLRERVALRAKAGEMVGEGTVEVHAFGNGAALVSTPVDDAPTTVAAHRLEDQQEQQQQQQQIMETVETAEPLAAATN